jgi:hypothetical protein
VKVILQNKGTAVHLDGHQGTSISHESSQPGLPLFFFARFLYLLLLYIKQALSIPSFCRLPCLSLSPDSLSLYSHYYQVVPVSLGSMNGNKSSMSATTDNNSDNGSGPKTGSIAFDLSGNGYTSAIRLIGLPGELVIPIQGRIMVALGNPQTGPNARKEFDSHLFLLPSSFFDPSKDPRAWKMMVVLFQFMTEHGWELIKATPWVSRQRYVLSI